MALIERGTTIDGTPVPRSLFGDDKIQAAVREGRLLTDRAKELLQAILDARFNSDPPDNRAARDAVFQLIRLSKDFRNLAEDLKLHTEVTSEGSAQLPDE